MRQSRNFKFQISLIFSPLGIAQTSLALLSLVEKIQIVGTRHATSISVDLQIWLFGDLGKSVNLLICKSINWFPTPSLRSSPCKGDRFAPLLIQFAPKLVQSSPLFKGSTCGAGVGLVPIKNLELRIGGGVGCVAFPPKGERLWS